MRPLADVLLLNEAPLLFTREEIAAVPDLAAAVTPGVDWDLVVSLRRKASDQITQRMAELGGDTPVSPVDRRLLGRSVVRMVVAQHAERLSADGAALWPVETEAAYAHAVEKAANYVSHQSAAG
ncbi:MAG: hypothetical protein QM628_15730 [Propionicimonas sp.]